LRGKGTIRQFSPQCLGGKFCALFVGGANGDEYSMFEWPKIAPLAKLQFLLDVTGKIWLAAV
jgi:hypothetical protein